MKYGAIDIGTNSCRLLIAVLDQGALVPLHKELETTRIGEGLHHSNLINEAAWERNLLCLLNFRNIMQVHGVEQYRAIATSAVREATNGQQFVNQVWERSHIQVDIVSGAEEARLSYLGVEKGLKLNHPPLVVDLGGGSIEFICNDLNFVLSIPLGAVRATELNLSREEIKQNLAPLAVRQKQFHDYPLVFTGGTASSLVAIKMGLESFDSSQVHGQSLTRQEIESIYLKLAQSSLDMRRNIPGLQPERADIIVKGALIVLMTVDLLKRSEIIISESDLLQGIIWSSAANIIFEA